MVDATSGERVILRRHRGRFDQFGGYRRAGALNVTTGTIKMFSEIVLSICYLLDWQLLDSLLELPACTK